MPGELPTLQDWADHLTTLFPEARLNVSWKCAARNSGNRAHLVALPAFWTGLLYDQSALDGAWDLAKGWDAETREDWRVAASISRLQAEVGGRRCKTLPVRFWHWPKPGLFPRGLDEARYLAPLSESIRTGEGQADRLIALFKGAWQGDLSKVYAATSLL